MSAAVCPLARCRAVLVIEVVRGGAVVTSCPGCERRRAGLCKDCPRRVYGTPGKALRCEECAHRARLEADRKRRQDPEVRRHINARDRKRRKRDRAFAERKRRERREWAARNPDKVRRARRRLLLSEGASREKYLATQRRHNADPERAAKKRAQALARYYELHPTRPQPTCAGCGGRLAWTPQPGGKAGAPPKWCDDCCPKGERYRRRRLGRSIRVLQPETAERVA